MAEAHRPFDLSRGPVLRTKLIRQADGGHVLLFMIHHIVGDVWSLVAVLARVRPSLRCGQGRNRSRPAAGRRPVFGLRRLAASRCWEGAEELGLRSSGWTDSAGLWRRSTCRSICTAPSLQTFSGAWIHATIASDVATETQGACG